MNEQMVYLHVGKEGVSLKYYEEVLCLVFNTLSFWAIKMYKIMGYIYNHDLSILNK
jgi:hypothetical protein